MPCMFDLLSEPKHNYRNECCGIHNGRKRALLCSWNQTCLDHDIILQLCTSWIHLPFIKLHLHIYNIFKICYFFSLFSLCKVTLLLDAFILLCLDYCFPVWSSAADSYLKCIDTRSLRTLFFFNPNLTLFPALMFHYLFVY